jgi:Tfp pilus assembly protein PilF
MDEGQRALTDNDLTMAEKRYRAALELRPNSPEALEGLGGTLAKAQQPAPAIPLFERAVAAEPTSAEGWRGLVMAQIQSGNAALGLTTEQRIPAAIHGQLMNDPLFLLSLSSAYSVVGRGGDAEKALESAVKLPFPADAKSLKADTEIQLAGLLFGSNHLDQAEGIYSQVIVEDQGNSAAWQGLVRVQHAMGHDDEALKTAQSMPPATYATAMREPGFELTVASIYEAEKKLDEAQDLLQKAATQQTSAGQKPSVAIEMQLANVYAERGSPQLAYPVYEQVIAEDPNRADAWAGLLSALHVTGHDNEAVEQLKGIPAAVRAELDRNAGYLQTMASVYEALGRSREASPYLNRMEQDYAAQSKAPPAEVEIQNAWLLYNGMEDADLYRQLMDLGQRSDLTPDQRRTVQTIWTNWAVRRANQASAAGNTRRALAILNAAAKAFPDNPAAIKALAIGYSQAGQPQQAVQIYKAQNMTSASAADYEAAVGAALADGDDKDAEIWLRYALAAYPSDPQILILGAKFEQARGDTAKAIKYYRASLKAMPPAAPGSKQAVDLGLPGPTAPLSLPNVNQPQDLSVLLAPQGESSMRAPNGQGEPYLPSYRNQAPLPPDDNRSSVVPPYMTNPGGGNAAATATANGPIDVVPGGAAIQPPSQAAAERESGQPAESSAETYRPYVAYIAPPPHAPAAGSNGQGVTGKAVLPVQLGDNTPPPVQQQTDMTDVLPTARYAPSARANQAAAAQPEVNAARAARIRKLQEDAAARTGQSQPPPEGTIAATPQNAQYTPQPQLAAQNQGAAQVSQPSPGPSGRFGNVPDTGGQQYPQPRTPPAPAGPTTVRSRPATPAPAPPLVAVTPAATTPETVVLQPTPLPEPIASNPPAPLVAAPPPIGPAYPLASPPTDAELRARNLPALGGAFESEAAIPLTPRGQAESQLAELEGSYSGWLGATGNGRYRSGLPGLDRLYDVEAPVEASAVLGSSIRLTAVASPVFLNSGVLTPTSFNAGYVPYLGTLPSNTAKPPAQQFSNGIGGELQLAAKTFGLAVGYTPFEFPVHNVTGRFELRTLSGHLSLFGDREPVKDTQLSYAGLRDPGVATLGPVWGGVVSTRGGVRLDFGSSASRFYISGDGGILTGRHVLDNTMFEGTTGASFRAGNWPRHGSVTLGGALSGMHYEHNEVGLTYGQGGYFSPGSYFLASVPVTFDGRYGTNFHYTVAGALGVETFEQEAAPFYPLDPSLQSSFVPPAGVSCSASQTPSYNCGEYPLTITTLFSYAINAEASYRFADHWYGGGFVSSNNASNYNTVSAGFFFRYAFSAQHSTDGYPPGLFRVDGLRPLQIP